MHRSEEQHKSNVRKNDASRRSEEQRLDIAPKCAAASSRRTRHLRPSSNETSSGILAPGRSVLSRAVLSDFCWPCLSQPSVPFEDLSPRVSASLIAGPPLMGFLATLDKSIVAIALQSVKELESQHVSFETCYPPWGLCPGS